MIIKDETGSAKVSLKMVLSLRAAVHGLSLVRNSFGMKEGAEEETEMENWLPQKLCATALKSEKVDGQHHQHFIFFCRQNFCLKTFSVLSVISNETRFSQLLPLFSLTL